VMIPFLTSGLGSCQLTAIDVDVVDVRVTFNGGPLGTVQMKQYNCQFSHTNVCTHGHTCASMLACAHACAHTHTN